MLQLPLFQQLKCASNSIACPVYMYRYNMAIQLSYRILYSGAQIRNDLPANVKKYAICSDKIILNIYLS